MFLINRTTKEKKVYKQVALLTFNWKYTDGTFSDHATYEFLVDSEGRRSVRKYSSEIRSPKLLTSWVDTLEGPWENSTFPITADNMTNFFDMKKSGFQYLYDGDVKYCSPGNKNV